MKHLILIIMFLLICPSLILAEEKGKSLEVQPKTLEEAIARFGGVITETRYKKAENLVAASSIANSIFNDIMEEYQVTLVIGAVLHATEYNALAEELLKEINIKKILLDLDYVHKYSKEYKYTADDTLLLTDIYVILSEIKGSYIQGMAEGMASIFHVHKDLAKEYKDTAPQLYEMYLDNKKKAEEKEKS